MFFNKTKKTYIIHRDSYFEVGTADRKSSLTSKERKENEEIDFPLTRSHILKYDSSQKVSHKFNINGTEVGISNSEITIPYILDFIKYKNGDKIQNILLQTDYFSMCLLNGTSYMLIEHSKEEGRNADFFSHIFNFEPFLIVKLNDAKAQLNTNTTKDIISGVIFVVMMYLVYALVFEEEEVVKVQDIVVKQELVMTPFQKELHKRYKQRIFLDKIEDEFSVTDFYEKMFSYIYSINIDKKRNTYEYTKKALFNMIKDGYVKNGANYIKKIDLTTYDTKNSIYKFTRTINKSEKDFYKYLWVGFNDDDVFKEYAYSTPYKSLILNKYVKDYYNDFEKSNLALKSKGSIYPRLSDIFKEMSIEADEIDMVQSHFKYKGTWNTDKLSRFLKIIKLNNIPMEYLNVLRNETVNVSDNVTFDINFYFILKNTIKNDYNTDRKDY
jgi:hypothetical protein